ncbi:hypothetical protein [Mycobacterium sp. 1274761.0]|uniref:hypothetical protein n=1 Tax=Mycobacterium sp. 1274761.0 TaxID=1834077 RepID=UPI000800AE58|nr:hypothetical protein [Mycobacterium sp. 1274761.0]OBK76665.1 hypothetical protein A5651_05345 [Mycobacterium sp. 1274761.0]
MRAQPTTTAPPLRGTAAGLLTAALAVAAHGTAAGAAPAGAAVVLLVALSATVGGLAATVSHAADVRVLLGLLATAQLVGHVMLAGAGHHQAVSPTPSMMAAHAVAVVAGAVLIAAGDRLCGAVSRAVGVATRPVAAPIPGMTVVAASADQPLRSSLLLATSVSHRGPPVSRAR